MLFLVDSLHTYIAFRRPSRKEKRSIQIVAMVTKGYQLPHHHYPSLPFRCVALCCVVVNNTNKWKRIFSKDLEAVEVVVDPCHISLLLFSFS
jgi:hypothetical protein